MSDGKISNEFNSTWASDIFLSVPRISDTSLSDDSKISQLDGSSDFSGLAGINCESNVISAIINIFRSLENIWETFENHQLCLVPHAENDHRCMLCMLET